MSLEDDPPHLVRALPGPALRAPKLGVGPETPGQAKVAEEVRADAARRQDDRGQPAAGAAEVVNW